MTLRRSQLVSLVLVVSSALTQTLAQETSTLHPSLQEVQTLCERLPSSPRLELTGLGTATFGDINYNYNQKEDAATLTNGVCVRGEGWTLEAASLQAANVSTEPIITASAVVLRVGDWGLESDTLLADGAAMQLAEVRFTDGSQGVTGAAARATYAFSTASFTLDDVWALGQGYRVSGARATLSGETLVFDEAVATTCTCGPPLYTVSSPELRVEGAGRVLVRNGVLNVGGAALTASARVGPVRPLEPQAAGAC